MREKPPKVRHIKAPKVPPQTPWVALNFCVISNRDSTFVEVCRCGRVSIYPFKPKDTFSQNVRRMNRSIDRHRKGCAAYINAVAGNQEFAEGFNGYGNGV